MWKTFAIDIGKYATSELEKLGSLRVSDSGNVYKLARIANSSGSTISKGTIVAWVSPTDVAPTAGSTASPKGVLTADIPNGVTAYVWILIHGVDEVLKSASYTSPAVGDEVVSDATGRAAERTSEDANEVLGVVVSTSPFKVFVN